MMTFLKTLGRFDLGPIGHFAIDLNGSVADLLIFNAPVQT